MAGRSSVQGDLMSTDAEKARYDHWVNSPYRPSTLGGQSIDADLRAAHALECIAAQLGQINAKLSKLLPDQKQGGMP